MKRTAALLLSILTVIGTGFSANAAPAQETEAVGTMTAADSIAQGTILHCFCWDFETISNSLEDIAAAGFTAIQTSPINEVLPGEDGGMQLSGKGKWYYNYQPVDFKIGNYQLGTREQFKAMCEKAEALGIKVIIDAVPNHTTSYTDSVSEDLINAAGGRERLYHKNSDKDITDWSDRMQCTNYNSCGCPDINTENKDYQDYFIAYLNDCIDCGADGFRYDSAKHIGLPDDPKDTEGAVNNFWERITTGFKNADQVFQYGEVLYGDNCRVEDYIKAIGCCTASRYGENIRSAVTGNQLDADLVSNLEVGSVESCVTWVESHDNYCNDGSTSQTITNEQIILGWAIIAARAKGTPLFFDRPYGATPEEMWGMNRIGASGDLFYKDHTVSAVNYFRNAMTGEDESFSNPDNDKTAVQICRGSKGAVIVNTANALEVNFKTDLADGSYTDRVNNTTVYTVKDGVLTCDTAIPENSVVVLYNEGYVPCPDAAQVSIDYSGSYEFSGDEITVALSSMNAEQTTYSVNDGEAVSYQSGDSLVLRASDADNGIVTLTLRGVSKNGQHTYMKYYFTKPASDLTPVLLLCAAAVLMIGAAAAVWAILSRKKKSAKTAAE